MRRRRPEKRIVLPDTKYNDLSVAKFINYIMENGKKGTAEKIFYGALQIMLLYNVKQIVAHMVITLVMEEEYHKFIIPFVEALRPQMEPFGWG